MTAPAADHADRLGPTRRRVLAHLQSEADPVRIESLADALGLHRNTVRFHLDALQQQGLVRRVIERQGRKGRPRALFTAAPTVPPVSAAAHHGLVLALLARVQADASPDRPLAEEIGESWGSSMVAPGQRTTAEDLVGVVNGLGLTSRLTQQSDGLQLQIVRCPFREFTAGGDRTVCRIHLGLMRGYLAAGGADLTVIDLEPWVTPESCRARLGPPDVPGPDRAERAAEPNEGSLVGGGPAETAGPPDALS
ncbi:MAG: helix-turn-helix domain-containing protein [Micropruina sp.]|nr:helix-turn-helix domain-containing protein [Micropruina sp.]